MEDITFILFGATGDLAKRKVIPAIYKLVKDRKLEKFSIIGAARSNIDVKEMLAGAKTHIGRVESKAWRKVEKSTYYTSLDFDEGDYDKFREFVEKVESIKKLKGNRVFYLATLPGHFDVITHGLERSKIGIEKGNWVRVVYEKPFGSDLKSAKKINHHINRIFREKQIYRIDHYLGKELVGNIALIRFTNRIFKPLWSGEHIESVQIVMKENIGIGRRGGFYDRYGALKDVVQNHVMQLLALTAMELPKTLSGEDIRNEKSKILKRVTAGDCLFGQYQGYRGEGNVKKNSNTETFVALKFEVNNSRWKGVPFYIKVGKYLDRKETGIHLKFKKVGCLLKTCPRDTNYFTIRIEPNEGYTLELNSKVQGKNFDVAPANMDFFHKNLYGPNTPEAYEVLLENVIKGDQSLFVRNDEVESAWEIIDKIKKGKVHPYRKGSEGPKELASWSLKNKMRWRV